MTRTEDLFDRLTAGITALPTTRHWQRWLAVQARFPTYSFANTVLITVQAPDATRVAGFHTWRSLGRHVRRGERGIRILAPIVRRADDTGVDESRTVVGFRPVTVFDVAQTDGTPLPSPVVLLDGDDPAGWFDRLSGVGATIGFTVERADALPGDALGMCSPHGRWIKVVGGTPPAQQVKTLVHELAHAVLHSGTDRPATVAGRELEAESVAWIVCQHLGLDASQYSFGYLTIWAGGTLDAVEEIRRAGTRIQRAAHQIVTGLTGP